MRERDERIHKILLKVEKRVAHGEGFTVTLEAESAASQGQFYRCDRSRPFRISFGSLRRLWYQWLAGGRTPEALTMGYVPGKLSVSADLLQQFVTWISTRDLTSLAAAWRQFAKIHVRRRPPTYASIRLYVSKAEFDRIQEARQAAERARARLTDAQLRLTLAVQSRAPVPRAA